MDSPLGIRRILVPLDLNRLSEGKLPAAEAQARAFGAEIILLHVVPGSPPTDGTVTVEESAARTYLEAVAARLRADGLQAHSLISFGPVAETILEQIETQRAGLLIIGTNVRRGFSRLLLGSVAESIVARATCPVLLVRPQLAEMEKTRPVRSFVLDAARIGAVAPRHLGIRTVDLARVVGSVGRSVELNEDFRISRESDRRRYEKIRAMIERGVSLPPPVLYKLGYGYYILDGNHRIAAAKELGQLEMEADVTEFLPLGDALAQRLFAERRAFERATGLTRVGAAQPGTYQSLEDMIREFAEERFQSDLLQAARSWEAGVYRPAARLIRAQHLRQSSPDQRTADIFVRLADFKRNEEERLGHEISWDEALQAFREQRIGAGPTLDS